MTIPTPNELKTALPLSSAQRKFIANSRQKAKDLLSGKDPRLVIIAGPCSIHDVRSAKAYAIKFKELARRVEKNLFLVLRTYFEKPRTTLGWKGLLYDPHLDGSGDLPTGLMLARELLIELAEMQVPTATEFLHPLAAPYLEDLVTWGFIGARTSSSQVHRQLASNLPMPVGFKNSIDGNIDCAISGIIAARCPHDLLHIDDAGRITNLESEGNPLTHVVLRGSNDRPNYDAETLKTTAEKLLNLNLPPRLLVDCAHGNCQKLHDKQKEVFYSVIEQAAHGNKNIIGLMLESHLEEGQQMVLEDVSSLKYGVSITDPCIDWEATEELIYWADSELSASSLVSC